MIQYINKKDIYGPFMKRQDVYLPHSAEVTSDKYTNMRYQVQYNTVLYSTVQCSTPPTSTPTCATR